MLLHFLVANRYWLFLALGWKFVREDEMHIPRQSCRSDRAVQADRVPRDGVAFERPSQTSGARSMPGVRISVAQAAIQACLLSLGHRAQCTTRLRSLGGIPAGMAWVDKETSVSK